MRIEYRKAELRAATNAFEVAGRAASYNTPSSDLGGFVEKLAPGCFMRSLASGEDVKCLVNHDSNQVLGRLANKTLTLSDAPDGLHFVCRLNRDSQAHRDLYASVKRGDLSECSFAFIVDGEDGQSFSAPDRNGLLTRTIKRAKLLDVSVVASPAYGNGATSVDARTAAATSKPACAKPRLHFPGPNEEKCEECTRVTKRLTYHTKEVKKDSKKRARELMAEYPELSAETIHRCLRLKYSEDAMLQLRFAEITKRQGFSFEPGVEQPGATLDARPGAVGQNCIGGKCSTYAEHQKAAEQHSNIARQAHSVKRAEAHYHAANQHRLASLEPSEQNSANACAASRWAHTVKD
jgi:hypothetical protein